MPNQSGNTPFPILLEGKIAARTKPFVDNARALNVTNGQMLTNFNTTNVPVLSTTYTVTDATAVFQYKKSKGAKYVGIEIEPQFNFEATGTGNRTFYVNITLPSGAAWANLSSSFSPTVSTDSRLIRQPPTTQRLAETYLEYVDVTNCTTSSILAFTASFYTVNGVALASAGHGFSRINAFEMPRETYLDSTSDIGISAKQNTLMDNFLSQSSTAIYRAGMQRVVDQLFTFKDSSPNQVNHTFLKDTNKRWSLRKEYSSLSGSFIYGYDTYTVSTADRIHSVRVNNTYGSSDATKPFNFSVAYETETNSAQYVLLVNVRPSGSSGWTQYSISLPASIGAVSYYLQTIEFPTNGINQVAEYYFTGEASEDPSDVLHIYNIFMHENNIL